MQFYILKMQVNITFMFWAVITLMLLLDRTNTCFIAVISAFLHEIGHLAVMFIFSSMPEKLTLGVFGMRIDKKENTLSYKKETLVSLAGPIVNFIIFTAFYMIYNFKAEEIFLKISFINLLMGSFNLIPIEPLDGGRAIKNVLSAYCDEQHIDRINDILTFIFLFLLFIVSVFVIKRSGYNFTLLIFCFYIASSVFLKKK